MIINIDENKLNEMVNTKVNEKINALTDDIIKQRVQQLLFDKINGIFSDWNNIDILVEQTVRENIKAQIPTLTDDTLAKACDTIGKSLAYEVKQEILSSMAFNLQPTTYDDTNDDENLED